MILHGESFDPILGTIKHTAFKKRSDGSKFRINSFDSGHAVNISKRYPVRLITGRKNTIKEVHSYIGECGLHKNSRVETYVDTMRLFG